ncbi:MAG: hypothetical protein K6U74_07380 [Firmicutes bacterium]|nr:hypothetical protein [Bacillota bacterium]
MAGRPGAGRVHGVGRPGFFCFSQGMAKSGAGLEKALGRAKNRLRLAKNRAGSSVLLGYGENAEWEKRRRGARRVFFAGEAGDPRSFSTPSR